MKTNIARQPILNLNNETVAYKLLFRGFDIKDNEAIFKDGSKATTEVIKNWLINFGLDKLTNKKRAYITFTQQLILEDMPKLLRKDSFIIELEKDIHFSDEFLEKIIELNNEGYNFALSYSQISKLDKKYRKNIEVIKIDFLKYSHSKIREILENYNKKDYIFLAEKIENFVEFKFAKKLGFEIFQGYYFAVPKILKTETLSTIPTVYIELIKELNKKDISNKRLAEITKNDVSLTYSVLNIVNSVAYYSRNRVKSIEDAYIRLGIKESKKLIYYNFLKKMTPDDTPGELIKKSLIRGKHAELLASHFNLENKKEELFLLGLLSLINIILKDDMNNIINRIHLVDEISEALLGKKNELTNVLDLIILYEKNYEKSFIKTL
ncbi:MAG: EAL and HDOD domain-containing protein, partial [Bacillota bacterium]